ncbi:MAG: carboxyvinyl-carboxyphosphonate phosphorylmutase [Actinobacteria bacterium]|nr:carboxyvinyl-carboxyphosphonate phosphorylmutase [Actinomycetota bacterium]
MRPDVSVHIEHYGILRRARFPYVDAQLKRISLGQRVRERELTVVPGVFDMLSARLAEQTGFEALYMTGYGVSASHLGVPDAGIATYEDMISRVAMIADGTDLPLIADGDTGFGGLSELANTVAGYNAAGACAIQLEDQEWPKKCGHAQGRTVVPTNEMVTKIEAALEARTDDDFLVIARTDARSSLGIDEAIARGQAYAASGADLVCIESPETEDEFARIGQEVDAPLVATMVEGGFSPILSADRLRDMGFTIALYPTTGLLAATSVLRSAYAHLRDTGSSAGIDLTPISEMHHIMDLR